MRFLFFLVVVATSYLLSDGVIVLFVLLIEGTTARDRRAPAAVSGTGLVAGDRKRLEHHDVGPASHFFSHHEHQDEVF